MLRCRLLSLFGVCEAISVHFCDLAMQWKVQTVFHDVHWIGCQFAWSASTLMSIGYDWSFVAPRYCTEMLMSIGLVVCLLGSDVIGPLVLQDTALEC